MTRSYKQLDILERQRIYFLRKQGFSLRKIAEDLSRSPSTISREVKRNSGGRGYRFAQAQRKARQRGVAASSVPRKMTERMWFIVESKLGLQWSHGEITEALGAGFFFATPYHSWERGLCEHTNGLVRQYFAKGTDFREVRGDDVRRVEGLINGRPRKVLEYRTPEEVFKEALALGG